MLPVSNNVNEMTVMGLDVWLCVLLCGGSGVTLSNLAHRAMPSTASFALCCDWNVHQAGPGYIKIFWSPFLASLPSIPLLSSSERPLHQGAPEPTFWPVLYLWGFDLCLCQRWEAKALWAHPLALLELELARPPEGWALGFVQESWAWRAWEGTGKAAVQAILLLLSAQVVCLLLWRVWNRLGRENNEGRKLYTTN